MGKKIKTQKKGMTNEEDRADSDRKGGTIWGKKRNCKKKKMTGK